MMTMNFDMEGKTREAVFAAAAERHYPIRTTSGNCFQVDVPNLAEVYQFGARSAEIWISMAAPSPTIRGIRFREEP